MLLIYAIWNVKLTYKWFAWLKSIIACRQVYKTMWMDNIDGNV